MEFRNTIFVVTEEHSCPLYNVGEKFIVYDSSLSIDRQDKLVCLLLMQELLKALVDTAYLFEHRITLPGMRRGKFECAGCSGLIRFEYKKEKSFSTLQMNLLNAAEHRIKKQQPVLLMNLPKVTEQHVKKKLFEDFFCLLRAIKLFKPLNDSDLKGLALIMKLKKYAAHELIIKEGERGTYFYVILSGNVAVIKRDDEIIAELGVGDSFGEMSLLSGEPAYPSVYSRTSLQLASLKSKDFKHMLACYPALQIFFYRLLVNRAQINTENPKKIRSGMSGELVYINPVELFQLLNSGGKSGQVHLTFPDAHALVIFNEGEIVYASHDKRQGKEALFTLLGKNKGSFTYNMQLPDKYKQMPVIGGFMGLLMEGLQRLDEETETQDSRPIQ